LLSDSAASGAFKYVTKANLGGGTTVQLARAEGTSSVSDITLDLFSDTYDFYRFRGWFNCTASGNEWRMRFRDGGSDITASYYVCIGSATEVYSSGSQDLGATMENWNSDHIRFANNSNSNDNIPFRLDAVFYDFNARDAGNSAGLQYTVTNYRHDNKLRTLTGSAGYFNQGSGESYEGFKLYTNGGSIEYYSYVLYGYKKS
jgi:hypothetical protein